MFHRPKKTSDRTQSTSNIDMSPMQSAEQLLGDAKRSLLLNRMRAWCGLESTRYEALCLPLLSSFAAYCQSLPETSTSYYAQPGGLLDHALNRTEAALALFQDFLVLDKPGVLSEQQSLWQYALYTAALLQGIGTLYVDFQITVYDAKRQQLSPWNPLLTSLSSAGSYYHYTFEKESDTAFRRRLNLLLARALMPQQGFSWIASDAKVLAVWLALLHEDPRDAGTLGAILIHADAIALQRYIQEFMVRSGVGRGGRYGRAGTFSGGVPETIAEKEQAIGVEFIQWLTQSLADGKVMINKAPLFMVPGGMLMSQELFQLFVRAHPEYKNWQAIQKGFLSLGVHSMGLDGSALSRFEQTHTQQMQSGVVFSHYAIVLPATVAVYQAASGAVATMSATELIHRAQDSRQFAQVAHAVERTALQKLTTSGQWQLMALESAAHTPGANIRV